MEKLLRNFTWYLPEFLQMIEKICGVPTSRSLAEYISQRHGVMKAEFTVLLP